MKMKQIPSAEKILEHYSYNPSSGVFTPIKTHGVYQSSKGYLDLWVEGCVYRAHRCAMVVSGKCVDGYEVDHINGVVSDNRLKNLRLVDRSKNCRNSRLYKTNTSGCVGVMYNKKIGKWAASIQFNKKRKHLGYFESFYDAVIARKNAEVGLDFTDRHGK